MATAGIRIDCYPGCRRPAKIRIDRAVHAARVFADKPPAMVLEMAPMLFSVCGQAQWTTAQHALAAADGKRIAPEQSSALAALVRIETAREHLWRALIDWPAFIPGPARDRDLKLLRQLVPACRAALFEPSTGVLRIDGHALRAALDSLDAVLTEDVLGLTPETWLSVPTLAKLRRKTRRSQAVVPELVRFLADNGWDSACSANNEFLPPLDGPTFEARLATAEPEQFVEAPDWEGQPRETSPLSRQQRAPLVADACNNNAPGLLPRLLATATELAATRRDVEALLKTSGKGIQHELVGEGVGIAVTEAARGRLVHRVAVAAGRVTDYRIVAPTEWNFHSQGVVSKALSDLSATDPAAAQQQANLFVTLMDPCVAHSVEVH